MICDIAYTQVNYILSKMSEELKSKIPIDLIEFIKENDNKQYQIDSESISDLELHEDTKKILSVIYTDYLATEEERKKIKNRERILELRKEEEKEKKYDVDVFANRKNSIQEGTNIKTDLIVVEKEKWYKMLFNRIRKLFRI